MWISSQNNSLPVAADHDLENEQRSKCFPTSSSAEAKGGGGIAGDRNNTIFVTANKFIHNVCHLFWMKTMK